MASFYDVIIVGAGASGLISAIICARNNKKVLIIEKNNKPGKKIYATGNGKCNYTNEYYDKNSYRGTDTSIVDCVNKKVNYIDVINFFKEIGIYPRNKNGYYYPYSEQASSVVEVLIMEIKKLNVEIICEKTVTQITKSNKKFSIKADNDIYMSSKIILAAGGMANSKLGSDGSGFKLARQFGHSIVKPFPALVQLKGSGIKFKDISGVRCQAKVTLCSNNQNIVSEQGEIVFTDYGISGIPVLQLSRYASYSIEKNRKVKMDVDLVPDIDEKELIKLLEERKNHNNKKKCYEILVGLINNKLANYIDKVCNSNDIKILANKIKHFCFDIVGTNGFDNAQVTAGGVLVSEIDFDTLESKCCEGLFFAGEILDIDGTCGGYNLQWAWATGIIAGKSASNY